MRNKNYYVESFVWSTLAKAAAALLGFLTIPLLLGLWGKAEYGILSIAVSCNGYIQLLDMGMNTGSVRYLSQWKQEGKNDLIHNVVHSNNVFYGIVAILNIMILLSLAVFGENLFQISHEQFQTLRLCLYIICLFSIPAWVTSSYSQLLISNMEMAYTQKCWLAVYILRSLLIGITVHFQLSLPVYYFLFSMITAGLLWPYMYHCKKNSYIDGFRFYFNWNDFKIVFTYSLSVFLLSLFQSLAAQSRPMILSIFAFDVAETVAEYKIIESVPNFIISAGLALTGICLPQTSKLIAENDLKSIKSFAYKGTRTTAILSNILCVPFIINAESVLTAYVGDEYKNLSVWMAVWCLTALIQIHTTPGNSLVLAYGKTRELVSVTAFSCMISIVINIRLAGKLGTGSAVMSYFIYVLIVIGAYYIYYYKRVLALSRRKMLSAFSKPTVLAFLTAYPFFVLHETLFDFIENERLAHILTFGVKTVLWLFLYLSALIIFRFVKIKDRRVIIL